MTTSPRSRGITVPGLTLLEMTIVIVMILSLASATFAGANAWKNGSTRTTCIMNIRNVQQAVRCYQNAYGYAPGSVVRPFKGSQSIAEHLSDQDYVSPLIYDQIVGNEPCPGGGTYATGDLQRFPAQGELFIECSLADSQKHFPDTGIEW
jgi:type II secretory pathway pseudopilin PulG